MEHKYLCPACRKKYKITESHFGQKVKCRYCNLSFTLPDASYFVKGSTGNQYGASNGSPKTENAANKINFFCSYCGQKYSADISYAGRSGYCTKCNKKVTVPIFHDAEQQVRENNSHDAKGKNKNTTIRINHIFVRVLSFFQNNKKTIIVAVSVLLILACSLVFIFKKDHRLLKAESTVKQLFISLSENDQEEVVKIYPQIGFLENYYKSDSIYIINSEIINDSLICIQVKNYYVSTFGKRTVRNIQFFLKPDSLGIYSFINDSKGLTDFSENEYYDFAVRTGFITSSDSTDLKKSIQIVLAKDYLGWLVSNMWLDMHNEVEIIEWSWETGYGRSATGKGIVKNNSKFNIPSLEYDIIFSDWEGKTITSDHGYITYEVLSSGESRPFTFFSSYVGEASRARIILKFDKDMITSYCLARQDYTGQEINEYNGLKDILNKVFGSQSISEQIIKPFD